MEVMDYEKKYKEALENLKTMRDAWNKLEIDNSPKDVVKDIEYYFPELAESEDERIKKELISNLKETIENIRSEEIIPHDAKVLAGKMQKWISWLEKQSEREQKPAEWTAEDENQRINTIGLVKNANDCAGILDKETALNWLNDIKDRFVPQPKQEWSEEDERLRTSCIKHIEEELERIRNDKYGHSEIISDLKESCLERINWLKSLKDRYTWKPTKEQLFSLRIAIGDEQCSDCGSMLRSLLKDLKSL